MPRLALLAVLALALGVVACGGGDDAGGDSASSGGAGEGASAAEARERNEEARREHRERQEAAAPSPEEREAKQTAEGFYEVLAADKGGKRRTTIDSERFCELMSAEARRQTVDYARQASGEARQWNCEAAIELLVLRSKQTGGFKRAQQAEVIGVNAEGDRATATIRFGKGPATSVSLVKEDGEWKLGSSPAGASE
jgi:hypothetical protein